jgi:hypothetical protein
MVEIKRGHEKTEPRLQNVESGKQQTAAPVTGRVPGMQVLKARGPNRAEILVTVKAKGPIFETQLL